MRALASMGISAANEVDGLSEFDAVFEVDGLRVIGEVEGKDKSAISIEKITQLERNIAEDFARDGVNEFAHGILFGNPQRLMRPTDRVKTFTKKCLSSADRNNFALVLTHEMFGPAAYLESDRDNKYAAACREALMATRGELVVFPPVPKGTENRNANVPIVESEKVSANS